ncbi:MAG: alpha-amylase family glycosyl hydrolase [Desulfobacteraceae bacterium]|nr:alpha-amylase family glycosyl hydrolase [Desulfobacteraceae bacterium]
MPPSRYPLLFQINTRVWLTAISRDLGRPATLDDIPDAALLRLAQLGFEWVWLLSVWRTGAAGQAISRGNTEWRKEFAQTLPDLRDEDIAGSGFAITGYTVAENLGGDAALARLRQRLRHHGLRLMLDFVPNHTGLDHPWVQEHPEYYISGSEQDLLRTPQNWGRTGAGPGARILAHGRDPFFPGWPDTFQLNYGHPALQEAMIAELLKIATQCDGVRCDMAMLVLSDIFENTWGIAAQPFWPKSTRRVREQTPGFVFMAEVYWDQEWTLQQQGFDYTYDKRLYDRLRQDQARPLREHLQAGLEYQDKLARFMENHDEPRAAASFSEGVHQAAAVIAFLTPGLRLFHQGQLEGFKIRISPHLGRGPTEPVDLKIHDFYERLLAILRRDVLRNGQWRLLPCGPAWECNESCDGFIVFTWQGDSQERLVVVVNFSPHRSQCYVRLPEFPDGVWRLKDLLSNVQHDRRGEELRSKGLFLDEPGWRALVFEVERGG